MARRTSLGGGWAVPVLAAALVAAAVGPVGAAGARGPALVWHTEGPGASSPPEHQADGPINPASLVKIATTLWAVEKLGPGHRFTTRFYLSGDDLVVEGGADPDFQPENAFLVAEALVRGGLSRVGGRVLVDERFWIGWENGPEKPPRAAAERMRMMAGRLRRSWDPARWDQETRRAWLAFAARTGRDQDSPPRLAFIGEGRGLAAAARPTAARLVATHLSRPLPETLRRFNAWSNNDIERLGATLGGPEALRGFLAERWGEAAAPVRLETLSGLGVNRLTPRLAVRLLRDLERAASARGLQLEQLLPVAGCDPGTLESFPGLGREGVAGSVTGKTGSLTRTDGGIALLAGRARTATGDLLFCVAAPGSGADLGAARKAEERWLLHRLAEAGGSRGGACGPPMPQAGDGAEVRLSGGDGRS